MHGFGSDKPTRDDRITLVLPVKQLSLAKSRLGLPTEDRARLALHLCRHTLWQASRSRLVGAIVVVTRDPRVAAMAKPVALAVVSEPEVSDLNGAARYGHLLAQRLTPDTGVAVMVSDLPYLTADDITAYLQQYLSCQQPMYVADHLGTGTTSVVQPAGRELPYGFGPRSVQRHNDLGYRPARGTLSGLRTDLDTLDDLRTLAQNGSEGICVFE